MTKRKPKLVNGALPSIAPQLAELMVTRLGMDAICHAYKVDDYTGIFNLIRPELPAGVIDSEVREIEWELREKARAVNPPMPKAASTSRYSIYLPE